GGVVRALGRAADEAAQEPAEEREHAPDDQERRDRPELDRPWDGGLGERHEREEPESVGDAQTKGARREDKPRPHSDGDERRLPRSERDRDEGAHLQHERTGGRVPQEDEEAERDRGLDDRRRRWLVSRTDHGTDDLDPDDERDDAGDDELGPGRQTRERPELGQSAPASLGTTGARARVLLR